MHVYIVLTPDSTIGAAADVDDIVRTSTMLLLLLLPLLLLLMLMTCILPAGLVALLWLFPPPQPVHVCGCNGVEEHKPSGDPKRRSGAGD